MYVCSQGIQSHQTATTTGIIIIVVIVMRLFAGPKIRVLIFLYSSGDRSMTAAADAVVVIGADVPPVLRELLFMPLFPMPAAASGFHESMLLPVHGSSADRNFSFSAEPNREKERQGREKG